MIRVPVEPLSLATATLSAVRRRGVLLVTLSLHERPNVMTVGSVSLGVVWDRPMLTVMVRPSRFTDQCLQTTHDFTLAVLAPERTDDLLYCGRRSGRHEDKLTGRGLTALPAKATRTPLIDEAVITYECAVVNRMGVDRDEVPPLIRYAYYTDGDCHNVYLGEILAVCADLEAVATMVETDDLSIPPTVE